MKKIILLLLLIVYTAFIPAWADSFVVDRIDIQGLQRISPETVYTYLPIKKGESLRPEKTGAIIKALYNTGFFDHITLGRQGHTLMIHVVERPTIGQLKISGNSVITTEKLNEVMRSVNITEGRVYDRVMLERIKQSLLNQYYQLGRYNARVDVTVTPMPRNRVLIKIDISEGLIAKVQGINIIGAKAFSEKELNKQLVISTSTLFSFFTQKDRFSQEKLDTSIENLRNFYLDHGYLKFAVLSSQASITPDRKSIFVTITIHEGEPYKVSGIDLTGNLILPRETLMKRITFQPGSTFSRKSVVNSEKAISDALGEKGYVFAEVSLDPKINDEKKEAFLVFIIKPGKRVYVRHVYFSDNAKTNDEVLRREIEQMEASQIETPKLEQSKTRLLRLPFIKDVQMSIVPVRNEEDQADVNFKVTEESAAKANFSIGYSQLDHVLLSAGLNQKNFLGTGNTLGFNLSRSRYQNYYGINYSNPYFTSDGISRSLNFSISSFDPKYANASQSYSTNQFAVTDVYGIPIGQEQGVFNRLQLGYGYENTVVRMLSTATTPVSNQVIDFVNRNGRHFQQLDLITGFSRDSRDRYVFPTRGMLHSLSANIYLPINDSLKYYILDYNAKWYYSLTDRFITVLKGEVGYGNSFDGATNFPFFKNFYAGGIDSIRGFDGNTLGPRDSNDNATGGNLRGYASAGLIFPNYISDNLRTTVYFDVGNVYNTFDNKIFGGTGTGPVRYSVGLQADWLSPMGLIDVSIAHPFLKPGDRSEFFQFALGANFG